MSADDADLPPDTVPPELDGLVERHADGRLGFSRILPTPDRARRAALVGLVPLIPGVVAGLVAAAMGSVNLLFLAAPLIVVSPVLAVLAVLATRAGPVDGVAGPDGIDGDAPLRWEPLKALRLVGSPGSRQAMLALVRPDGTVVEIKTWVGLASHRARGWDHDSVRWFGARVAELAGTVLEDGLGDAARWQLAEAADRHDASMASAHLLAARPVPPREEWSPEGVDVYVDGKRSALPMGVGATSYRPSEPVRITATAITVGPHTRPRSEIHGIEAWFEKKRVSRHLSMQVGQVRARLDHGHWVLLERAMHVGGAGAGEIVGAAASIEAAWRTGRAIPERGDATDIPDAVRQVASAARNPGATES